MDPISLFQIKNITGQKITIASVGGDTCVVTKWRC
ncbi:MAG: hypothetical protein ACJAU1_001877 [Psychromonas sp.]|jgi:hypothetical protein